MAKRYSAREFFKLGLPGRSMTDASRATSLAYSTIQSHVSRGRPVSARTAKRLEDWSDGAISASKTLGIGE